MIDQELILHSLTIALTQFWIMKILEKLQKISKHLFICLFEPKDPNVVEINWRKPLIAIKLHNFFSGVTPECVGYSCFTSVWKGITKKRFSQMVFKVFQTKIK